MIIFCGILYLYILFISQFLNKLFLNHFLVLILVANLIAVKNNPIIKRKIK